MPGLVSRSVRKLIRPGNVAAGIDVRVERLQIGIGFDRPVLLNRDTQLFEAIARHARHASNRAQKRIVFNPFFLTGGFDDDRPGAPSLIDANCVVGGEEGNSVSCQRRCDDGGCVRVFADQYAVAHFDDRDRSAEPCHRLRELTSDRTAAQHDQTLRKPGQVPERVGGKALGG